MAVGYPARTIGATAVVAAAWTKRQLEHCNFGGVTTVPDRRATGCQATQSAARYILCLATGLPGCGRTKLAKNTATGDPETGRPGDGAGPQPIDEGGGPCAVPH